MATLRSNHFVIPKEELLSRKFWNYCRLGDRATTLSSQKRNFYHERQVEVWKKFWEFYGTWVSQDDKRDKATPLYCKNDFVVDLSGSIPLMEQLDCSYIWVEIVEKGPIEPEKKEWLPKMLSRNWLILVCGYGKVFEVYRPDTYLEEGNGMTSEKTEEVLNELLKQKVELKQKLLKDKTSLSAK